MKRFATVVLAGLIAFGSSTASAPLTASHALIAFGIRSGTQPPPERSEE
jgi:hypothetical protein